MSNRSAIATLYRSPRYKVAELHHHVFDAPSDRDGMMSANYPPQHRRNEFCCLGIAYWPMMGTGSELRIIRTPLLREPG